MTEQEFNEMWDRSLKTLSEYVDHAAKVSKDCEFEANSHVRSQMINEGHYRYVACTENTRIYSCSRCGHLETASYCEPTRTRMIETSSCFHCNFWDEKAVEHQIRPYIVIDGRLYYDAGRTSSSSSRFNGFGGQEFKIEMDDGSIVETNNLWSVGIVVHTHIHLMTNNAKFLKG